MITNTTTRVKIVEQRKLKRRHLIYYLRVFDKNADKPVGHLVDITEEGFKLISETPIKTNKIYHFKIELPALVRGTLEVPFTAKSIWCDKDINPEFYNTGFQLRTIEPDQLDIIRSLIARFRFHD